MRAITPFILTRLTGHDQNFLGKVTYLLGPERGEI